MIHATGLGDFRNRMGIGLLIAAGANTQRITATGDVVAYGFATGSSRNALNNL
ncbi:MAG: hypothetical protein LBK63_09680 [Treponema sp.]|nr:hypothetical protein [Treponema sp.]